MVKFRGTLRIFRTWYYTSKRRSKLRSTVVNAPPCFDIFNFIDASVLYHYRILFQVYECGTSKVRLKIEQTGVEQKSAHCAFRNSSGGSHWCASTMPLLTAVGRSQRNFVNLLCTNELFDCCDTEPTNPFVTHMSSCCTSLLYLQFRRTRVLLEEAHRRDGRLSWHPSRKPTSCCVVHLHRETGCV